MCQRTNVQNHVYAVFSIWCVWLHVHMPAHMALVWCVLKIACTTYVYGMKKMKEQKNLI